MAYEKDRWLKAWNALSTLYLTDFITDGEHKQIIDRLTKYREKAGFKVSEGDFEQMEPKDPFTPIIEK